MKRAILALLIAFPFSVITLGQASTHSVALTWVASPDAAGNPTLTYNVYRSLSTCAAASPSFVKIGTTGTLALTDTTVTVSGNYCYAVTSLLNGAESAMSTPVDATVRPSPPSSVAATVK